MTNTIVEDKEVGNEPLTRLEIASVCLLVELGIDPIDAYNLIYELKEFSPEYHGRILECTGLYIEARSALLNILKEIDKTKPLENTRNQETFTKIPYGGKAITKANIQTGAVETEAYGNLQQAEKTFNKKAEKIEVTVEKQPVEKVEKILEELRKLKQEQETVSVPQEVKQEAISVPQEVKQEAISVPQEVKQETVNVSQDVKVDIPPAEQVPIPESASQEIDLDNKEEIEKWLRNTESRFEEMPVEMQEETMSRYIQLRTNICKDKMGTDSSCIGCLIGNTIDCPLFNRTSKKNGKPKIMKQ
ncbi:MAG: hypothetical protein WED07_03065 [Candidatus Freyarchaeum deiterrae]